MSILYHSVITFTTKRLHCTIVSGGEKMAISDKKTRTLITLEKTDKENLENIAKKENRSFNNLIETVLKNYLANK